MVKPILRLGNDIVDLSVPRTKLKHLEHNFFRFLDRVFAPIEKIYILNAACKPKILWAIWAAKEAAYKALKKQFPQLIFSLNQFIVTKDTLHELQKLNFNNNIIGTLLYNKQLLTLNWQYNINFVHCIAVLNNKIFNNWEIIHYNITEDLENLNISNIKKHFTKRELISIYSEQSLKTRFYAKQFLKSIDFEDNIEIIRSNSPPALFVGEKQLDNEISLSHDGKFMAICCC